MASETRPTRKPGRTDLRGSVPGFGAGPQGGLHGAIFSDAAVWCNAARTNASDR